MYCLLRHPGYVGRAALAAGIFLGAAALVGGRPAHALRAPAAVWGLALAALGIWALLGHGDDGWVVIAGLVFVAEGAAAVAAAV